eukprot:scaffold123097_cov20-Tisochrysis_lutea.AAC.2
MAPAPRRGRATYPQLRASVAVAIDGQMRGAVRPYVEGSHALGAQKKQPDHLSARLHGTAGNRCPKNCSIIGVHLLHQW